MKHLTLPEKLFQTPLVDQAGIWSRTWAYLFRDFVTGANAAFDLEVQQAFDPEPQRPPDQALPATTPRNYEQDLADLATTQGMPHARPWQAEIDDLRALLALLDTPRPPYDPRQLSGTLANRPTGLRPADKGLTFEATDFARVYRWTGTAWERAPGERPTREFCYFAEDPGTGWQLCDGTAGVTYTKADATTATMTMPAETAGLYRKSGNAYTGSTIAAVPGAISGSTDDASTGLAVDASAGAKTIGGGTDLRVNDPTHHHSYGTLAVSQADVSHVVMLPYMKL